MSTLGKMKITQTSHFICYFNQNSKKASWNTKDWIYSNKLPAPSIIAFRWLRNFLQGVLLEIAAVIAHLWCCTEFWGVSRPTAPLHIIVKGSATWRVRRTDIGVDVISKDFWQPRLSSACGMAQRPVAWYQVFQKPPSWSWSTLPLYGTWCGPLYRVRSHKGEYT